MTHYLVIDEVLMIHERMIEELGGRGGVHDFLLLHSAVERPKANFGGNDLYPTIFDKAAALIQSLILNHPFDDGNKPTTITSTAAFLARNGYEIVLPAAESIQFTLDIDAHRISFLQTAKWLQTHTTFI